MATNLTFHAGWVAILGCWLGPTRASALPVGDVAELELLIQPMLALDQRDTASGDSVGIDPYLGAATLTLSGQPTQQLSFFAQTGVQDFGLDGDWSGGLALRLDWIETGLGLDWNWIETGLGLDRDWIGTGLELDWDWIALDSYLFPIVFAYI